MLVLHPNSRCDVCLEGYHGHKEPLAITCGHIFCQSCLAMLPRHLCPLCRLPFHPSDARRLHVDKAALPPTTPLITSDELSESAFCARRLQSALSQVVLVGSSRDEFNNFVAEVRSWLSTQPTDEHPDLRAAYLLLIRYTGLQSKMETLKEQAAETEQGLRQELEEERQRLDKKLAEEREAAAEKYEELEKERERLATAEEGLKDDVERLRKECDEWKLNDASDECRRLSEELDKAKRSPRHLYLHDISGAKAEQLTVYKEDGTTQLAGKDAVFHLSPVALHHSIPELPPSLTNFAPLTDDIDDTIDDDRSRVSNGVSISSASQSIPIKSRSDYRTRSNSSLLSRPDPDAMSISVPRSMLDVHMSGSSTSPKAAPIHYNLRPVEFVSNSVGRVPENALGLRADPTLAYDPELKEQQERRERLAQLRDVLHDPYSSGMHTRKPSLSEDRARSMYPTAMSSTRTPSPTSQSHAHTPERDYPAPYKHQLLGVPTPISVASTAAAERERARASSVNSQNAPSSSASTMPSTPAVGPSPAPLLTSSLLSHVAATREPPLHQLYPTSSQGQPRPLSTRRDSASSVSGSISRGKASTMGYQSGLSRSMRVQAEAPRVS